MAISGSCDSAFEPVRAAFAARTAELDPGAAGLSVRIGGREVVALRYACEADALFVMMSSTKGVLSAVCMLLADRGVLDVDAPVRKYWPQFRDERVLVRHVLEHDAGMSSVPGYREFLRSDGTGWDQWDRICEALARSEAETEPGTQVVYHGLTMGWILGEVVRRVDGRSVGKILRQEIGDPFGIDVWIGLPDVHHDRVADVITPEPPPSGPRADLHQAQLDPDTVIGKVLMADENGNLVTNIAAIMNDPGRRRIELPWGAGIGSPSGLAHFYEVLPTLVSERTLKRWTTDRHDNASIPVTPIRWGIGFQLNSTFGGDVLVPALGPGPKTFGHGGFGGQIGLHDPEHGISAAFLTSRPSLEPNLGSALLGVVYDCL